MKRVLVTGANGFIGLHCLPQLVEHGYEVHALSSKDVEGKEPGIFWHQVDLLNIDQARKVIENLKPSHLLHLAWYTAHGKYWTSEINLLWVQASLSLIQIFAKNGGQRVVTAGTCAEYNWSYGYCSEKLTPLEPSTLYGVCKNSLQLIQTKFSNQIGLSSAWGRVFFLYGPNEHPDRLVAYVIRSLIGGERAKISGGTQIRDFLFVQDVANAFVSLLESNVTGPVNIGSGNPQSLKDLILNVAEILNMDDMIVFGSLKTPDSEPALLMADVTRLNKDVRWSPVYDLKLGLTKTIDWWQMRLSEGKP